MLKVLVVPYVPGVCDRLRTIANRYQVSSWFSYPGRLGDGFTAGYKDPVHQSKLQNSVYEAMCCCGRRYVGETSRNLKVRVTEHNSGNSWSALSLHLQSGQEHSLISNHTQTLIHEKHCIRRKLLESLVILHVPHNLCNTRPLLNVSDMCSLSSHGCSLFCLT